MSAETDQLIDVIKNEQDILKKVKLLTDITRTKEVKIKDIAEKLGVKSSYICHLLRLNRLPEVVVDGYYSDSISLSHLFIISRVKDPTKMVQIYEKVLAESLTVKGTEEVVRDILYGVKTEGEYIGVEEKNNFIEKITGYRKNFSLKIIQTRIKSKIIFEIKGGLDKTSKQVRDVLKGFEMNQTV